MDIASTTVLILAAGRGERMRPLTDHCPKPLLKVGQHSLIEHHIKRLQKSGFKQVVINIAHLGQQIIDVLGSGKQFGLQISYSDERESGALETAGGIKKVFLSQANTESLLVINGDIWTDFNFSHLLQKKRKNIIVLTKNPEHNSSGDFSCDYNTDESIFLAKQVDSSITEKTSYTFTGIGIYSRELFDDIEKTEITRLAPLLFSSAKKGQLQALIHEGEWFDIGTPERLQAIRQHHV